MTLQASGNPISLANIQGQYGGTAPLNLNNYYRGGPNIPIGEINNGNIPTSGTISLSNFYGQGVVWRQPTSGVSNILTGVASNASIIVVTGTSGTILTSTDLNNWTVQTSGTTNGLGVCLGNGLFVAFGGGGTILTSSYNDGVTWTPRTSGVSNTITHMIWDGTAFIASMTLLTAGDFGKVLRSTDGINWSVITVDAGLILSTSTNYSLTAGGGIIAIGITTPFSTGYIYTSSDHGLTWTQRLTGSNFTLGGEGAYSSSMGHCMVGTNGSTTQHSIVRSSDGITWTVTSVLTSGESYTSVSGGVAGFFLLTGNTSKLNQYKLLDNNTIITTGNYSGTHVVRNSHYDSLRNTYFIVGDSGFLAYGTNVLA